MYHYVFSSYLLTIILINQSVHLIKAKLQSQCLVSLTESNKRENWNAAGAWDGDSHNILSAVTLRRYFYCPLLGREQSTCGTWYNDPSGHLTWPGYWAGALVCYLLPYLHHIVVWKNYTCLYHFICQLVLSFIFLKNMRVIKTRPGPGSPRCCWWHCRCGAVRWWEVMQGRAVFSVPTSASKSSIRRFVITKKAPTRAYLRHY